MVSQNGVGNTKLRTWVRGVPIGGALCGVFAMLMLVTGCPVTPPGGCTSDADCPDDGNVCTTAVCDTAAGTCSSTNNTASCDDSNACTSNDACSGGTCAGTAVAGCCNTDADCATGEACSNNVCETVCAVDADCDDANDCTDDACVNSSCTFTNNTANCDDADACTENDVCSGGTCSGTTKDCSDTDACTVDTCDSATGMCSNTPLSCPTGQTCDQATGTCTTGTACTTDADCPDDGLFCNGTESCDTTSNVCQSSGDPCTAPATCDEGLNTCVTPAGPTIPFTLAVDNLTGTAGDDLFSGVLAFNPPTGTNVPTVQSSDTATGGDGIDTAKIEFNEPTANNTISPTLTDIEIINITDFGNPGGFANTLSLINSTGVTEINSINSTDTAVTVTNVNAVPNLGVTNTTSDLLVTLIAPATNGNADSATLKLNGSKAGSTVTIATPVNGLETLTVDSSGPAANTSDAVTQTTGTTLTTFKCTGNTDLTITAPLNTQLTTVDCSAATGKTNLTLQGAQNVTYTGGSGDDFINFAGTYTSSDTINGGTGTNTLGVNSAQAVAATTTQANVSNISVIRIVDPLNGAVDVTKFGATDATLDTTAAATNLTAGNSTLTLGSGPARTLTLNNDNTAHTLGVTISGAGTSDTLTLNIQNADLGNTLTATGVETLAINSGNGADGTASNGNTATAITLIPTFGSGVVQFTGDVAYTLTGAITAATIDASGLNAALTMGATTVSGGTATITGSASGDTLIGSTSGDSISGGDGDDKIIGGTGGDSLIGGNGTDTFQYTAVTDGGAVDADNVGMDLVNGFVLGSGGDILAFQDNIFFDNNDTLDLDVITGVAAGTSITGLTDGGASVAQIVVQTTPLTNFAAVATLFTTINGGLADATPSVVVIAEVTGVGTFIFYDADTSVANGERVLGQMIGVTGANLVNIVAANLAINDG